MGLQDYTYRIKAQSGDTTIHDEKGVSGDMTGGTKTLVDMGSGDYAWQIASGRASVAVPSKTFDPATTGGGVTIAVRLAITSYDASSFAFLMGWATDAASTPTKGLCLGQNGTNIVRSRWIDTSADTLSMLTVNNAVRTYVLRATSPASGLEKVHAWVSGVTGSGDTADYISSGQNYTSTDLDTAFLGSSGSTVRVSDFVIWPEELTDAQCHALAENGIRATLDSSTSPVQQDFSATRGISGSVQQDFAATRSIGDGVQQDFSATRNILAAVQQDFAATRTVLGPAGVSLNVDPDHVLRNNTGSIWANTQFKLSFSRADTDAFVVNKTVTTNASGLLGFVSDAALTAGVNYDIKIKSVANPADMGLFNATAV